MKTGKINSIETFGTVDGPGIRYVLFLKNCPLRCLYCHNPETWSSKDNNVILMTTDEVVKGVLQYKAFHGKQANITISGGEPLMQFDFLLELVEKCKANDIHVCIDTSGSTFVNNDSYKEKLHKLAELVDLWMIDIKHIDPVKHKILTGKSNENIIEFIKFIDEFGKEIWVKYVLVPTYSDDEEDLRKTRKFMDGIKKLTRVEVLPFHKTGEFKWEELGEEYLLKDIFAPSKESYDLAKEILIKK